MSFLPNQEPLYRYVHPLRSRYGETDKMGYVYYGRYLEYFENARTEMLRSVGLPYARMEEEGVMLPVTKASLEYRRPVFYDQLMHIHVLLYKLPDSRLETWYEVINTETGKTTTYGFVELCFVSAETRKPIKAPQTFLDAMERLRSAKV
jgi:acyl-CoA thioester hydrolase